MKNTIKVDFKNSCIVMDKTFAKLAEDARSNEYAILQNTRRDYPGFRVTVRQIKKNVAQERYKGLTYDFMRMYIATHDSNAAAALSELEEMICISQCHSTSKRYPVIKSWFLATYPEIVEYGIKGTVGFFDNPAQNEESAA